MLNIRKESNAAYLNDKEFFMKLSGVKENIIHVSYSMESLSEQNSMIIDEDAAASDTALESRQTDNEVVLSAGRLSASVNLKDGLITWKNEKDGRTLLKEGKKEFTKVPVIMYTTGGEEPIIKRVKTVDGERNFIQNLREESDHDAYQGRLHFSFTENEAVHGMGQGEDGIFNYRMHTQYLYQHNMRIPMPMFISSEGYGILFDATCLMTFSDNEKDSYMYFDAINQLEYYVVLGDNVDEIISGFRFLTGKPAMLPKWAFGYIQSKEQYYTADELLEIVKHYREIKVPLDCVVQDWNTWEPGDWGQKSLDPKRYSNMKERADEIHALGAHTMVSVWPNMNTGTPNHTELFEKGYMLNDYATYDAFNEEAREIYWKQAKEGLFDQGFDSWWCDSTEPFSGPDWGGEIKREPWVRFNLVGTEHKKYLTAENANAYSLVHSKGMYENQRKTTEEMRVLNLTRSGYASSQKYAAVLWSGDITAEWSVMKGQIAEGLNMAMSGYPYWTLDIGGFFTVGKVWQNRGCSCNDSDEKKWFWQGRFDEGVKDKGFCELYTRWIEFGCFLPMFRSHGTDTPREIWNFGDKGTMFYDAIEKYIKLRYLLMPYIYSMAGASVYNDFTIMRSLIFDFAADKKAAATSTQFMFGKAFLVCPVFEPMYYEAENEELNRDKKWKVYLPEGSEWYDFETNERFDGGQELTVDAPIDKMPLFVKAGSIVPMKQGLQYAMEETDTPLEIHVYPGADGEFNLYEDAGNDYTYEKGDYALVNIKWDDIKKSLTIGERQGCYEGMKDNQSMEIWCLDKKIISIDYNGKEQVIPV